MPKRAASRDDNEDKKRPSRGVPPHPTTFTFSLLPDDAQLTQHDVAAITRKAIITVEKRRRAGSDGLSWHYLDGRWPRTTAGSLRNVMRTMRKPQRPRRPVTPPAIEEIVSAK
jgi:hypothetical protein